MKYAVIQTGGKQYKVHEGDILDIEQLPDVTPNSEVVFESVLLMADRDGVHVGTPFVSGITVRAVVKDEVRGEKIRVRKYKAKVRHRRVRGHRQSRTRVAIQSIGVTMKTKAKGKEENVSVKKPALRKKAALSR